MLKNVWGDCRADWFDVLGFRYIAIARSLSFVISFLIMCVSQTSWAQNNSDVSSSYSERGGSFDKYIDLKKLCSSLSAQENPISNTRGYTYAPLGESYNACMTTGRRQSKTK